MNAKEAYQISEHPSRYSNDTLRRAMRYLVAKCNARHTDWAIASIENELATRPAGM